MSSTSTLPSSDQIASMVTAAASTYGVDPDLALAVAQQESGLNPAALSPAGAVGVMQLEPSTASDLGVNPYDVQQNINGGVQYLAQMLEQFGGNTDQALAAYNAGPTKVSNAISTASSSGSGDWLSLLRGETQNYVASILSSVGLGSGSSSTPASSGAAANAGSSGVNISMALLLTGVVLGAFILVDLLGGMAD